MATTPLPFPHKSTGSVGPVAPLPEGAVVAHLTIERALHEGLHNVVYLARDPDGEALALMEYFPRALALRQPDGSVRARQAGDAIALSVGREAFVLEANTLERIQHPGIVRVLGSLQAHRTVYRAMKHIDGATLERHIAVHGNAPSAGAAVRLLDQLLEALDALHRAGVVHGCVRPDQILVTVGERTVLLGMGSAGAEIVGHEAGPWSAPEQAAMSRHDRINSATDLYMAAATAWCYATGETPPALRDRLAQPDAWDPAAALAELPEAAGDPPGTRARLAAALSAALALLPAERPQRVGDLRRLLAKPGPASTPAEPGGTVPLWVGVMPDRDAQWEVYEKEVAYGRHAPSAPAPAHGSAHGPAHGSPHASVHGPAHGSTRAPITDLPHRPRTDTLRLVASDDPLGGAEERPLSALAGARRSPLWWGLSVVAIGLALGAWWALRDRGAVVVLSPEPAASAVAPPAVAPPTTEAPLPALPAPAVVTAPAPAAPPAAVSPEPPPPVVPSVVAPPAAPAAETIRHAPLPAAPPVVSTAPTVPAVPAVPAKKPSPPVAAKPAPPPAKAAAPASPQAACGKRTQFALLYCLQDQCSKTALRNHPQCNELRRRGDIQ